MKLLFLILAVGAFARAQAPPSRRRFQMATLDARKSPREDLRPQ